MLKYPIDRRIGAALGALIGILLCLIIRVKGEGSAAFHLGQATFWVFAGQWLDFAAQR